VREDEANTTLCSITRLSPKSVMASRIGVVPRTRTFSGLRSGGELAHDLLDHRGPQPRAEDAEVAGGDVLDDLVVAPLGVPGLADADDVRRVERRQLLPHGPVGVESAPEDLDDELGALGVAYVQEIGLRALGGQLAEKGEAVGELVREAYERGGGRTLVASGGVRRAAVAARSEIVAPRLGRPLDVRHYPSLATSAVISASLTRPRAPRTGISAPPAPATP
jgi:hypothetical protein